MKDTILFIESSDIGIGYSTAAAKNLGYEPLFLLDLSHYQGDPRKQLESVAVIDADTSTFESLKKALENEKVDRSRIAAVTSFADNRLTLSIQVAEFLGVPGIDSSVLHLKSKEHVAELVPEWSPISFSFSESDVPTEKIRAQLKASGKLFLKPTSGAGALGAFTLLPNFDLDGLSAHLKSYRVPKSMGGGMWVAQAFIPGELMSCEGFVTDGRVTVLGFTNRRKIGATESGARFPIDDSLSYRQRSAMINATERLVEQSGFVRGYFHNEFIVEQSDQMRSPMLIDANMGRIGGGAIAEQLAVAFDLSPVRIFEHVLALTLFPNHPSALSPFGKIRRESYAILYGLEKGGKIYDVTLPDLPPLCHHTRLLGNGTEVSRMGENDWSWIAIVSGPTADTFLYTDKIRIRTDQGEMKPYF